MVVSDFGCAKRRLFFFLTQLLDAEPEETTSQVLPYLFCVRACVGRAAVRQTGWERSRPPAGMSSNRFWDGSSIWEANALCLTLTCLEVIQTKNPERHPACAGKSHVFLKSEGTRYRDIFGGAYLQAR